jgi:hypothetical protein
MNNTGTLSVDTTPTQVPLGDNDVIVIVNNGPGKVWFGSSDTVTSATGLPLGVTVGYEFARGLQVARWPQLWVVSDGTASVSYASVG